MASEPADDRRPMWSEADVRALGVTTDLVTAGAVLGIGRTTAHALARADRFPVPVLRVGRRYRVPTAPLLRLLALTAEPPSDPPTAGDPAAGERPFPVDAVAHGRGVAPEVARSGGRADPADLTRSTESSVDPRRRSTAELPGTTPSGAGHR